MEQHQRRVRPHSRVCCHGRLGPHQPSTVDDDHHVAMAFDLEAADDRSPEVGRWSSSRSDADRRRAGTPTAFRIRSRARSAGPAKSCRAASARRVRRAGRPSAELKPCGKDFHAARARKDLLCLPARRRDRSASAMPVRIQTTRGSGSGTWRPAINDPPPAGGSAWTWNAGSASAGTTSRSSPASGNGALLADAQSPHGTTGPPYSWPASSAQSSPLGRSVRKVR